MAEYLERAWYGRTGWLWLLLPLSWLYAAALRIRRAAYRLGLAQSTRIPVPVLVVGNFTVGGTGKTPLVTELARRLAARGMRPGIVTRGYGGKTGAVPRLVAANDDPAICGDEAVLMARRAACPVAAFPRRVEAAALLVEQGVNFILADDGLQHLALARDAEIAVKDASRGYGNGRLLPTGPLREHPRSRPAVDLEFVNGPDGDFRLAADEVYPLGRPEDRRALQDWAGRSVHAVAGIGNPERFFATLTQAGLVCERHAFPDHHAFQATDLRFADDDEPVFMTEKDAVKCEALHLPNVFVVPVDVVFSAAAGRQIDKLLDRLTVLATE